MPRRLFNHRTIGWAGSMLALAPVMALMPAPPAPQDSAPGAPAAPAGSIVLEKHVLHDPGSNNMQSHVLLAPKGWKVEGQAFWAGPNFYNILPSQDVKVTAPSGVQLHIAPSIGAADYLPSHEAMQYGARRPQENTADNGYIVLHLPATLEEWRETFKTKLLPQAYPNASSIHVEPVVIVPEFTQVMQQQLVPMKQQAQQMNQQSRQYGLAMQSHVDGAILAASSTYVIDGQKWEQLNLFGVIYWMNDSQTGRQITWSVEPNVMFRAPAGELEKSLPLLITVGNSLTPTPQWSKMKADHIAAMNRIAAKGAADRSAIIADSHREVSRIISEGWEQRQASLDRTHRKTINAIRGVDDYVHPGGERNIQLPHNYQHVYTNGSQYILTNDPNYDPNRDQAVNNLNWDRMRRAEP